MKSELAIKREAWFKSDEAIKCLNTATLTAGPYLKHRLERAFLAGAKAMDDKRSDSFEAALKPAIEYLKGCHPHCSVIVTSLHAELLEGVEVINEEVPELFEGTLESLNKLTHNLQVKD